MAILSEFQGKLVGYSEYVKDGKVISQYYVLCEQKQNSTTKLYEACELVSIRSQEGQVLPKLEYGAKVKFYGELIKMASGSFMAYSGITAV